MKRLKYAIQCFIWGFKNPKSKLESLKDLFNESLTKIDGVEVPYYDLPREMWENRGFCQVFLPQKEDSITYDLEGKEIEDSKKSVVRSFILTKQLIDWKNFDWKFSGNTDEERYMKIIRWIKYFKKVYRRESRKFMKDKIGIPVLVGLIVGIPEVIQLILKALLPG